MKHEIEPWGRWKIVWVKSGAIDKAIELVEKRRVDGFGISPFKGFRSSDLSFVDEVKNIKGLVIPSFRSSEIPGLTAFKSLQFLSLGEFKRVPELGSSGQLEHLQMVWTKGSHLPENTSALKILHLWKYSPESETLSNLSGYRNLNDLRLTQSGVTTLEGIEHLSTLEVAELHYMSKLQSIRHIAKTSVERLTLSHCKKVSDLASVVGCRQLHTLRYHDSAALPSIHFINDCLALREFRFVGVDVIDGDMTPLVRLDEFAFTQKKHFSHTEKELRELKSARE